MNAALLEITSGSGGSPGVRLDFPRFVEKRKVMDAREELTFKETADITVGEVVSASAPVTYNDTLLFIAAAQDECYHFFGLLMESSGSRKGAQNRAGRAGDFEDVEGDGVDGEGDDLGVGESVPVSEWSQEEEPKRKKGKHH